MTSSLDSRFQRFLRQLPGAESVDDLPGPVVQGRRRADFLLRSRSLIVEVKSLEADPADKVEAVVAAHRDHPDFPLFYSDVELKKVLAHLPDGDAIYAKIVDRVLRKVKKDVHDAEEQTTHTRQDLNLGADSQSMLVLLNEAVDILDPRAVAHRVANLQRRTRTGLSQNELLDCVFLLFESHALPTSDGPGVVCMPLFRDDKPVAPWLKSYVADLLTLWASFNGGEVRHSDADPLTAGFRPTRLLMPTPPPTTQTRGEAWRAEYRSAPYLRHLDEPAFLEYAADLMLTVRRYITQRPAANGSPVSVDRNLLERYAHFLEEARFRGLDFKKIPKRDF